MSSLRVLNIEPTDYSGEYLITVERAATKVHFWRRRTTVTEERYRGSVVTWFLLGDNNRATIVESPKMRLWLWDKIKEHEMEKKLRKSS